MINLTIPEKSELMFSISSLLHLRGRKFPQQISQMVVQFQLYELSFGKQVLTNKYGQIIRYLGCLLEK